MLASNAKKSLIFMRTGTPTFKTTASKRRGYGLKHIDTPQNNLKIPFNFSPQNQKRVEALLSIYPDNYKQAAVIPLMDLAQRQHGWLSISAMHRIAEILNMKPAKVFDVSTFYTMFLRNPTGSYHIQVCTTTPCWLAGSDNILEYCKKSICIDVGETSKDGKFTLSEVECLGACVNAPIMAINDDFYEDLIPQNVTAILMSCKADQPLRPGPQNGRCSAEPKGKLTALIEEPKGPGFGLQKSLA